MILISRVYKKVGNKILDPRGPVRQRWNKVFMFTCLISVLVDILFFYIPVINDKEKCLHLDGTLKITACVLRSCFDLIYIFRIIFQFRTGFLAPSSRVFGRGVLVDDRVAIVKRYLNRSFVIDFLSIIPLPQMVILNIIPMLKSTVPLIFVQYLPRLMRIYPLWKEIPRNFMLTGSRTAWSAAGSYLVVYILASHTVGSSWYLFSVESELRCWQRELKNSTLYNASLSDDVFLSCEQRSQLLVSLLNSSCTPIDPDEIIDSTTFNFGIFNEALTSHVVESTTDFPQRFFYCFWWGLRNISSLGQNLKTSTFIGNMQRYLQSRIVREEEMMVKRLDTERWMSQRMIPDSLRERIRRYENYKWQENGGVDEETLIRNFPKDLRRDVKRHLCLSLLRRVPLFEEIDDPSALDVLCDRLKSGLYTQNNFLAREGDPVDEMLFIMQGQLDSVTTHGGRTGFFNSVTLKAGDFCGEELLTWAFDRHSSSNLPISTRTVRTLSEVEAFALTAEDLRFVVSQFQLPKSKKFQHVFRFYSLQWRTWAACFIQAAWRRYRRKKMERSLFEAEARLLNAVANESQSPSLGATIYASRFAANALRTLRQDNYRLPQLILLPELSEPQSVDDTSQSNNSAALFQNKS